MNNYPSPICELCIGYRKYKGPFLQKPQTDHFPGSDARDHTHRGPRLNPAGNFPWRDDNRLRVNAIVLMLPVDSELLHLFVDLHLLVVS